MAGRKRKQGKRERNGKPQRQTGYEVKLPVLEQRCRLLGWEATYENLKQADKYGGTLWGLIYLGGGFTERHFETADRVAEVIARHDRAMGLPRRVPGIVDLLAARGRSVKEPNPESERRDIAAMDDLRGAIGNPQADALVDLACERIHDMALVVDALNRAADYLGFVGSDA